MQDQFSVLNLIILASFTYWHLFIYLNLNLLTPPPFSAPPEDIPDLFDVWPYYLDSWLISANGKPWYMGENKKGGGWAAPSHSSPGLQGRIVLELGENTTCTCAPMSMTGFSTASLSLWRTWACKSCLQGWEGRTDMRGGRRGWDTW